MKKTLSMLAIMSALLVSCAKSEINEDNGNPQDEPVYEISISPKDLTFGAKGGDQTVTVTSSEDWYLDGESDWCKVSTSYGSNGDKVTFSADPYENTAEERTATFTFYCGDKDVELVVTQEAKVYSISVEPKELTFEVEGGEKEITITSSDNWNLSDVPEWITLSEDEGENGVIITVTVEYNDETDTRSGDILFICGDKDAKVSVTQQADDSPIIQFKDPYFLDALLETYTVSWNNEKYEVDVDKNNDGQISENEAASVEILDLEKAQEQTGKNIRGIDELTYFTGLKFIVIRCQIMQEVNLGNAKLEYLAVYGKFSALDVSGCKELAHLECNGDLTTLDISNNAKLKYLDCSWSSIESLDFRSQSLEHLVCDQCQKLKTINVKECPNLKYLDYSVSAEGYSSSLTSIDASGCSNLLELTCDGHDNLTSLKVDGCTALTELSCRGNQLTSLDISSNTALTELWCSSNQLTSLDLSSNAKLIYLNCRYNQLAALDLSNNTALTELWCDSNQLTSLDLSNNKELSTLYCYSNDITSLDLSKCTKLSSLYCVNYELTNDYPREFDRIIPDTKCPLESLKIYKYHTIWESSMKATSIAYGSVIEYVE